MRDASSCMDAPSVCPRNTHQTRYYARMTSATSNTATPTFAADAPTRCGTVAIVGRPNVGKSTLLNALVGQKVSITSHKAQTTRHRISGVATRGAVQYAFVDTPGFQTRHDNALNRHLNKAVRGAVQDVDVIFFVVQAGHFGAADAPVLELLDRSIPTILVASKLDQVHIRASIAPWLQQMAQRFPFAAFVPIAARQRKTLQSLFDACTPLLPQQDWIYDAQALTDRNERFMAAEIIREKIFRLTGDELPYNSTVVIDQWQEEPSPQHGRFIRLVATIIIERDSHKAMIIGRQGERIRRIGSEARQDLEHLWQAKVFLALWVKTKSGWADSAAQVQAYGYGD